MSKILICSSPTIKKNDVISCDSWQVVDFDSIALKTDLFPFEEYLGFDDVIFAQVLAALLVSFITGHVGGLIVRNMNRV